MQHAAEGQHSSQLHTWAVEPSSVLPSRPSNRPMTPSTMATSQPTVWRAKPARVCSWVSIQPSRLQAGLPVAASWCMGSRKSAGIPRVSCRFFMRGPSGAEAAEPWCVGTISYSMRTWTDLERLDSQPFAPAAPRSSVAGSEAGLVGPSCVCGSKQV